MKEAGQKMNFGKKPIFEINSDHALVAPESQAGRYALRRPDADPF
jgi:hypothetical protein